MPSKQEWNQTHREVCCPNSFIHQLSFGVFSAYSLLGTLSGTCNTYVSKIEKIQALFAFWFLFQALEAPESYSIFKEDWYLLF